MIRAIVSRDHTGATHRLREIVQRTFGEVPLERLHDGVSYPLLAREADQSTSIHQLFYDHVAHQPAWERAYTDFVRRVVRPLFPESIAYQVVPTFRVHLPGNVAVGEFHRDRDYGHAADAVTIWAPLTEAVGTATIHVAPDSGATSPDSCVPIEVPRDHFLLFDGVNVLHGNLVNEEGYTRVSVDLRVIPMSAYRDSSARSVNTGSRLAVGDYYEVLE